jgi:ABC-2 type transport system permease protein
MTKVLTIGLRRGLVEHVQFLRDRKEAGMGLLGTVGVFTLMALWLGDDVIEGTNASKGSMMAAGFLAYSVFRVGLIGAPTMIATDREEGALLRLRALPGGLPAYLIRKAVTVLCQIATHAILMMAVALLCTDIARRAAG